MSSIKHNVADVVWKSPSGPMEVVEMTYTHRISEIPLLRVELKSEALELEPKAMVNQEAQVDLMCGEDLSAPRVFKGIITRFGQKRTNFGNIAKASQKRVFYEADVQPKFWNTTKRMNTRVFRQKTVKEIASQVLDEHGVSFEWKLAGEHITRDHTVQYQETDYQFISRLMEDEGIYFYFTYELDKVIFADHAGAHDPCKPTASLDYSEERTRHTAFGTFERILDARYEELIGTGKFTVDNYNYETSQQSLKKDDTEGKAPNFPALENYEHTINYPDSGRGTFYAKTRKEAETAAIKVLHGLSTGRSIHVGFLLTMAKHFHGSLNKAWLIISTRMEVTQGKAITHFEGFETEKPYRPVRKTPRPQVFGVQTAVVTGPAGSKVYLDQLGRCKLQFHWDREGKKDEQSSMWVRVSNNYAGKNYGIQWIPRVGHEVLVSFVDGNPDVPIVTGRVYNDLNTPPLGPGEKWQNIIKTIKDNHILFDDADGAERIEIRAEKDMSTIVVNNESYQIGNNKTITVGKDHVEQIGRHMTLQVAKNCTETIGENHSETVGVNRTTNVGKSHSYTVGDDLIENVGKNTLVQIGKNFSTTAGGDFDLLVSKQGAMDIGKDMSLSVGKHYNMKVSKKTALDSGDQIVLKTGSATVTLKKSGDIEIKGKKITIKGSGQVTIKGSKVSVN